MPAIHVNVLHELVLGLFTLDTFLVFLLLCSVFQGAVLVNRVSEAPYYGLNACVPLKCICWDSNFQGDNIWRWAFRK